MKLGRKSKDLLELMTVLGFEMVDAVLTLPVFYRSLNFSNERNFRDTVKRLHTKGLIDLNAAKGEWAARLTQDGKSAIDLHIDPARLWNENWDGNWRLITFDLPQEAWVPRQALRKWLKQHRFGRLQDVVIQAD